MSEMDFGIFTTAESFEEYYAKTAGRLLARREARLGFIREGVGRLERLQQAARAVEDTEMERDLTEMLETARGLLSSLEAAVIPVQAEVRPS